MQVSVPERCITHLAQHNLADSTPLLARLRLRLIVAHPAETALCATASLASSVAATFASYHHCTLLAKNRLALLTLADKGAVIATEAGLHVSTRVTNQEFASTADMMIAHWLTTHKALPEREAFYADSPVATGESIGLAAIRAECHLTRVTLCGDGARCAE